MIPIRSIAASLLLSLSVLAGAATAVGAPTLWDDQNLTWERCTRAWGNPQVPCLHADPILPDCAPGETVRVRGRLWFYEGNDPEQELARMASLGR